MIEGLQGARQDGVLTTHYMDEAQHLADRVRLRAGRSSRRLPDETRRRHCAPTRSVTFRPAAPLDLESCASEVDAGARWHGDIVTIRTAEPPDHPARCSPGRRRGRWRWTISKCAAPTSKTSSSSSSVRRATRPGGVDLRILARQTRYCAARLPLRNSRAVVFGIVFPVVLLVLFNSIFSSGDNATTTFHHGTDRAPGRTSPPGSRRTRSCCRASPRSRSRSRAARDRPAQAPARHADAAVDVHRRGRAARCDHSRADRAGGRAVSAIGRSAFQVDSRRAARRHRRLRGARHRGDGHARHGDHRAHADGRRGCPVSGRSRAVILSFISGHLHPGDTLPQLVGEGRPGLPALRSPTACSVPLPARGGGPASRATTSGCSRPGVRSASSWPPAGSTGSRRAWEPEVVITPPIPARPARPGRPGPCLVTSLVTIGIGVVIGVVAVIAIAIPLLGAFTSPSYAVPGDLHLRLHHAVTPSTSAPEPSRRLGRRSSIRPS